MGKKALVGTGIALVWIGGFGACFLIGQVTGKALGATCTKVTIKLLSLL